MSHIGSSPSSEITNAVDGRMSRVGFRVLVSSS